MLSSDKPVQTASQEGSALHCLEKAFPWSVLLEGMVILEPHSHPQDSSARLLHLTSVGASSRGVPLVVTFQHLPSPASIQLRIHSPPWHRHDERLTSLYFTMDSQREIQPVLSRKGS